MTAKEIFLKSMRQSKTVKQYIELFIHMPTGETERIINPNVPAKADYIERAYDDELHLKANNEIYIEDYYLHEDYSK